MSQALRLGSQNHLVCWEAVWVGAVSTALAVLLSGWKLGIFLGNNGLIEIHQTLGSFCSSEKEGYCTIFHDFIKTLRVWPIFSGTQSLNGNFKENGLVEWAGNWPGEYSNGFLLISMVYRDINKTLFFLSALFVCDCMMMKNWQSGFVLVLLSWVPLGKRLSLMSFSLPQQYLWSQDKILW